MCGFVVYEKKPQCPIAFNLAIANARSISHRGPDESNIEITDSLFVFHRLAIMDTSHSGMQPFKTKELTLVCNGEIYNFLELKNKYPSYPYTSGSDCEVLLPLFLDNPQTFAVKLDAEFACVIKDHRTGKIWAARDPIGIRPLFYSKTEAGMVFASELKAIKHLDQVLVFPPGHYYDGENFIKYKLIEETPVNLDLDSSTILREIRERLSTGVIKRLQSDVPVGFLLSGGLDSSLVCAIAAKYLKGKRKITTFAVGITEDPIDTKYARMVADYIGSDHHEFLFTKEDVLTVLPEVINHLETWDITTIRAAIGMYLICKYVKAKTDIKVLLTGEISDELFGYKYTDFAPSPEEFQKEAVKRVKELHLYDVLRADRSLAAHGLEARVPFGDLEFASFVMSINPALKMNTTGTGKYLLRKAFEDTHLLPSEIIWREKAAFSDAVGHSMVDHLKAEADRLYTDQDLKDAARKYPYNTPFTKESLWYRDLFPFPKHQAVIPDFWMPNKTWPHCAVSDPSARVLKNYGKSGL